MHRRGLREDALNGQLLALADMGRPDPESAIWFAKYTGNTHELALGVRFSIYLRRYSGEVQLNF